jgi:hypothetical protein
MTVVLSGYDQSRRPYSELTLTGVASKELPRMRNV